MRIQSAGALALLLISGGYVRDGVANLLLDGERDAALEMTNPGRYSRRSTVIGSADAAARAGR